MAMGMKELTPWGLLPKAKSLGVLAFAGCGKGALSANQGFWGSLPDLKASWPVLGAYTTEPNLELSKKDSEQQRASLPRPVTLPFKGTFIETRNLLSCCRLSVVCGQWQ